MTKKIHVIAISSLILLPAVFGYWWSLTITVAIYLFAALAQRDFTKLVTKNQLAHGKLMKANSKCRDSARIYWQNELSEVFESDDCEINPATGLYMVCGTDTAGNAWGFSDESDKFWNDSSHDSWLMDSSPSIDDQFAE